MKTFLEQLVADAKAALTGNGRAYLVKLLRPREGEDSEAYERLGRAVPIDLIDVPGVPKMYEVLGSEAHETPWIVVLHDDGAMFVPLSRYTPNWRMYASPEID